MAFYQGSSQFSKGELSLRRLQVVSWRLMDFNLPAHQGDRWIGAISAVKARAPVLGGNVRQFRSCRLQLLRMA